MMNPTNETISLEDKQRLWDALERIIEMLGTPIDTHGLVMLRLQSAAATLKANPGTAHTIYYDREGLHYCPPSSGHHHVCVAGLLY